MNSSNLEEAPNHIGRYQVKSLLGRGGMAVVYLAFDPYMERQVAIKVLLEDRSHDDNLRSRFKRESRMVASLNHPAIVPVYDFGEQDEQPYLVMRYMEGGSLRERLRQAPLTVAEVAVILNQIAPGLDTTHSHNIIHRDLKPSNILFDENQQAYLADFGLAKFAEGTYTTLTHNDGMIGTPAYMSPEQIRGQDHLDGRTDIYALGVILYEMLAGQLPFMADGRLPVALMHLTDPVPDITRHNASLPHPISEIITRAMAKSREERFATATELLAPFMAISQETLPPVKFPAAPPIILQPDSESSSSVFSDFSPSRKDADLNTPPEWLKSWLNGCGSKQDIGRSRTRGTLEDRMKVGTVQTKGGLHLLLAIVSDGGSSQKHGHLAAELAITELFGQIAQSNTAVPEEIPTLLQESLQQTNRTLFSVSQKRRNPLVMQSMVGLVAIHENRLYTAHVGNGRIYLLRRHQLHQLSRDLPAPQISSNGIPPIHNGHSHHSSSIGLEPELTIDLGLYLSGTEDETVARQNQGLLLQTNDRLLLCSDGLLMPQNQRWQRRRLRRVISENSPAKAAKILVQDALDRKVPDNVTAVVLQAPGTVPHVPLHQKRPVQIAAAAFSTFFLMLVLLLLTNQPPPEGVFVPPGTATQIAQIINGLTATAASSQANVSLVEAAQPLVAPAVLPDPGFAVVFAAGEGALVRANSAADWQAARSGDLVRIGEDAVLQSGTQRLGVVLSDGAELYLAPAAELMLNGVNQVETENGTTKVSLTYGRLLIHYQNADSHNFELAAPSQASVQLSAANTVAGIAYDPQTAILETDCFSGSCRLRNDRGSQLLLPTGRYGIVEGSNMTTRSLARMSIYCDLAPTLIACPTPTPAPTQTLQPIVQTVIAATETASAQTATAIPSATPSSTPSATATLLATPTNATEATTPPNSVNTTATPSQTPPPGATHTPQPTQTATHSSTHTPQPTQTAVSASPTPRPSNTPTRALPTATNSPPPSSTPLPSPTPQPQPSATPKALFTATPLPTFTPTKAPNS